MKFITKRLLLWALVISISGVSLSAIIGLFVRAGGLLGWIGIIMFITVFPLWIICVLIKYLVDILPGELDKLVVKK